MDFNESNYNRVQSDLQMMRILDIHETIKLIIECYTAFGDVSATKYDQMTDRQKMLLKAKRVELERRSEVVCRQAFGIPSKGIDLATWARSIGINTFGLLSSQYHFKPRLSDVLAAATARGYNFANVFHGLALDLGYGDETASEFSKNLFFGIFEARFRTRYPGWSYELSLWEKEQLEIGNMPCIYYRPDFSGLGLPTHLEFMLTKAAHWAYRDIEFLIPEMLRTSCNKLTRAEIKTLVGPPPLDPSKVLSEAERTSMEVSL